MGIFSRSIEPFLPDRDYLPVAMPTTGLQTLDVLTRDGSALRRYSSLDNVLGGADGVSAPEVLRDERVVDVSGSAARSAKLGLGLSAVGAILRALGAEAGLDISVSAAKSVNFAYSDVVADRVDMAVLESWLSGADILPGLRNTSDLLAAQRVYVVVAALRTHGLAVTVLDEREQGIELDVPAIQALLGAEVTVKATADRTSTLLFTGTTPLTVAAKAAQLKLDQHGIWVDDRLVTDKEIRGLGGGVDYLDADELRLD